MKTRLYSWLAGAATASLVMIGCSAEIDGKPGETGTAANELGTQESKPAEASIPRLSGIPTCAELAEVVSTVVPLEGAAVEFEPVLHDVHCEWAAPDGSMLNLAVREVPDLAPDLMESMRHQNPSMYDPRFTELGVLGTISDGTISVQGTHHRFALLTAEALPNKIALETRIEVALAVAESLQPVRVEGRLSATSTCADVAEIASRVVTITGTVSDISSGPQEVLCRWSGGDPSPIGLGYYEQYVGTHRIEGMRTAELDNFEVIPDPRFDEFGAVLIKNQLGYTAQNHLGWVSVLFDDPEVAIELALALIAEAPR
ncbi:MAG: hypothetical protein GX542_04320 [Rhodococcus sp.]|nr:hypothetical protein [Rhodococcus sp. (in: high G+C Gram-positive bacteria)]